MLFRHISHLLLGVGFVLAEAAPQLNHDALDSLEVPQPLARQWNPANPYSGGGLQRRSLFNSSWQQINHKIPEDENILSTIIVGKGDLVAANLNTVGSVTVCLNVEHPKIEDLSVDIRSPSGSVSHLVTSTKRDGNVDFKHLEVSDWGTVAYGPWTIIIKDNMKDGQVGTFINWKLGFSDGSTSSDPTSQPSHTAVDDPMLHQYSTPGPSPLPATPATPNAPAGYMTPKPSNPIMVPPALPVSASASESVTPKPTPKPDHSWTSLFEQNRIIVYAAAGLTIFIGIVAAVLIARRVSRRRKRLLSERVDFDVPPEDEDASESMRMLPTQGALHDADIEGGDSDEELFSDDEVDTGHTTEQPAAEERYSDRKMPGEL